MPVLLALVGVGGFLRLPFKTRGFRVMTTTNGRIWRSLVAVLALSMMAAACGGSDDAASDEGGSDADAGATESESNDQDEAAEIVVEAEEQPASEEALDDTEQADEPEVIPPPSGELRIAEFGAVTSFNPAAVNSAQFGFLIPVYDTLTRQDAGLSVVPGLATSWTRPNPNTWEFTVRDDVQFHDGTPFDAQVAVDNIVYHTSFEGNPNAGAWGGFVEARVIDATTFQVEFDVPKPQFPLTMSTIPGMMINPNYLDGSDLTRNPQGSGPWMHVDGESQAGVTEVYVLNPAYWNPADQGVEQISITGFPDNNARINALITGEVEISATVADTQVVTGLDAGMKLVSVPNLFPFILITDRNGELNPALADERVRQAIAYSIDRDAYNDAVHAGRADASGGIYPSNFSQFHWPEFDDLFAYDPDRARELLDEAGYGDGLTITMPIMPAIAPAVELIVQMLGATGINVELDQINNGELGPRMLSKEYGISWLRALLDHPVGNLPALAIRPWDTFQVGDLAPVDELVAEASVSDDPEEARELYAQASELLLESGTIISLGHAGQNAMYAPNVDGVVMGLGMQSPYPHGIRIIE